jgi:hypothetical protein
LVGVPSESFGGEEFVLGRRSGHLEADEDLEEAKRVESESRMRSGSLLPSSRG